MKAKQNNQTYISIIILTIILMGSGSLIVLPISGRISNWCMCNWGITYETGFIYRGLVGTICTELFGVLSMKKNI